MVRAKPGRAVAGGFGVCLGTAVFVITVGLTDTVGGQVSDEFDIYAATTVVAERKLVSCTSLDADAGGGEANVECITGLVSDESLEQQRLVAGVALASRYSTIDSVPVSYQDAAGTWHSALDRQAVRLVGIDFLKTIEAEVSGHGFNALDSAGTRAVVVIGDDLATEFGFTGERADVMVGSMMLTVVGILEGSKRLGDTSAAILVPEALASHLPAPERVGVIAKVDPGAAAVVADTMPLIVAPDAPGSVSVRHAPDPKEMKTKVSDSMRSLALGAGAIVLLGGMAAVANLLMLNVAQRMRELGMRRAVGAARRQVLLQVLVEAGLMGLISALIGVVVGVWVVYVVAMSQAWQPVVDIGMSLIAGLLGTASGLLGGLWPALVAARSAPAAALRL
jgi:hypothetical protein